MKSKSFTFKKGLALLLSLLMLTTGIPMSVLADTVVTEEVVDAAPAEEGSILYGDADDNGLVNLLDAVAMMKYVAKWNITINMLAADVTHDSRITLLDITRLTRYIAGHDIDLGPTDHTVTFVTNCDAVMDPQFVPHGTCLVIDQPPVNPSYTLVGWFIDESLETEFSLSTIVTQDLVLYAKWARIIEGEAVGSDNSVVEYSISSLTVNADNDSITAFVSAPENCALVVRFVEEDLYFSEDFAQNKQYINNGDTYASHVVAAGSNMSEITALINYNDLPESYVAEAVLIDGNGDVLCDPYTCITNTERYEEYDSKTVYDFSEDTLVLNFDASPDENFGVLADDVRVLNAEDVIPVDEDSDGIEDNYKILNPSEAINVSDKIFISDADGDFMFKVLSVTSVDGYLIVIPADADDSAYGFNMDDFYKFLKVDIEYSNDEGETEDGEAVYEAPTYEASRGINIKEVYHNVSGEASLNCNPIKFDSDHFFAEVKIGGKVSANLVFEWDVILFGKDYMRCDFTYTTDVTASLEVKAKWESESDDPVYEQKTLKLGKISIPFGVTGLSAFVDLEADLDWEINAGLKAEVVSSTTSGFKYNTKDGFQKIDSRTNNWTVQCEGHAEVKFGPSPSVGVEFMRGVLSCSLEVFLGAKFEADAVIPVFNGGDEKHACHLCVEGSLSLCITVDAKLEYKITDFLKGTPIDWNIISIERPLFDFYLSLINDADSIYGGRVKAGKGECENKSYKTTAIAKDADNNTVSTTVNIYKSTGAYVDSFSTSDCTYLYSGDYIAKATIDGEVCEKEFSVSDGAKTVIISKENADGYINGSVVDAETGNALSGATVAVYEYSTLIASTTTNGSGEYSLPLEQGTYTIKVSKAEYVDATSVFSIRDGENKYLETVRLAKEDEDDIMGGIYGIINDGLTGNAVSDVNVKITRGWGNTDLSEVVCELTTNSYGEYSYRKYTLHGVNFGLDAGNYTITISKRGYVTTTFNITIVGGEDMLFNSTITPTGSENVYRIVLTWGATPSDLDSHFNGTYNGYRDHVYYSQKQNYSANLDVDDTSSYGPETVTIPDISLYTGNIMYSVHDYTNKESTSSTVMSNSGATVKVYRGAELIETFYVPTNRVGTVWNVFYIDSNNNIVPVNSFANISNPSSVYGSTY